MTADIFDWTDGEANDPTSSEPAPAPVSSSGKSLVAPLAVALVAALVSVALIFVRASSAAIVGYLMTPIVVVICLGWAWNVDLKGRSDPWFDRRRSRRNLLVLRIAVGLSFLIAIPHVWAIAKAAALWLQ